jgi:adenosylhomocysteinase
MAREGVLAYPLLAVNDAATKHLFDNRYGTGQSTIDGILRATNVLLAGKVFVVVGYGWCGRGLASRARGMGARVVWCEVDPLQALEAVMEGYQVLPVAEAARVGEVFVTVTGNRDALTLEHLQAMPPGPSWPTPATSTWRSTWPPCAGRPPTPPRSARRRRLHPAGRQTRVIVLAEGRLVGQSCAEAHPAEVMDLTFATQALAVARLATRRPAAAGVHPVRPSRRGAGRPPQAGRPRGPLRRPHPRPAGLPARLAPRHLDAKPAGRSRPTVGRQTARRPAVGR